MDFEMPSRLLKQIDADPRVVVPEEDRTTSPGRTVTSRESGGPYAPGSGIGVP